MCLQLIDRDLPGYQASPIPNIVVRVVACDLPRGTAGLPAGQTTPICVTLASQTNRCSVRSGHICRC